MRYLWRTSFDGVSGHAHVADGMPSAQNDAAQLGEMPGWNLSDLYPAPDSSELAEALRKADQDAEAFAKRYQNKLESLVKAKGGQPLYEAIRAFEALQDITGRTGSYAYLTYVTRTADPACAKFFGDMQEKLTNIGSKLLFFVLEINRIDDVVLERAMRSTPLNHYKPWLEELRKEKPYQLSDDLERLFHETSVTGRGGWSRLFSETMTAMRFEVRGQQLTLEPALNLLLDQDAAIRREGAEALTKTFSAHLRLFTLITNVLAKEKEISDRWRGFRDVAASRHLANNVEPEVVAAMVSAVHARFPSIAHRYYAMKARWLGKERLEFWDRNAPLTTQSERSIPWEEAKAMVLAAYERFSPQMAEIARTFFDNGWIDVPVREGKAPGAFSHATVPSAHPYIMLNYLGKPRDVMTLAHELGHGVHQVLANAQGPLMAYTPLTLAETASVFGEMLTFKDLLAKISDPKEKKLFIAQKVEEKINTVVRQVAFYEFERRVHTERRDGELTSERIGEIWMEVQAESLGPSIRLGEGYETYWTYIPHFIHSPFYVYAYAFGDCLVNSLYAVYESNAKGFQERYLAMLKAGGTKHHKELLAPFGLDASNPDFWAMGLGVIEAMIAELEAFDAAGV